MTDAAEIIALSQRIVELELKRDADALSALIRDDYVGVDPSGAVITKDLSVGRYRDPDFQLFELGISDVSVRVLGHAALEVGIMNMRGRFGTFTFGGNYRYSHVWLRCPDGWKIAGSQLTPVLRASAG